MKKVFIVSALNQILAQKKAVSQYSQNVQSVLKAFEPKDAENDVNILHQLAEVVIELVSSKNPQLVLYSLDLLSKMLQYDAEHYEKFSTKFLEVIELASTLNDEKIQLQIFKCIQSGAAQWHEHTLLKAVRIIYNFYLLTGSNSHAGGVAQSTISQIIQNVFGRIEIPEQYKGDYTSFLKNQNRSEFEEVIKGAKQKQQQQQQSPPENIDNPDNVDQVAISQSNGDHAINNGNAPSSHVDELQQSNVHSPQSEGSQAEPATADSLQSVPLGDDGSNLDQNDARAVASGLVNDIVDRTVDPPKDTEDDKKPVQLEEQQKSLDQDNKVAKVQQQPAKLSPNSSIANKEDQIQVFIDVEVEVSQQMMVYLEDALLLFRALCRLSMKTLPEEKNDRQSKDNFMIALKSKILALELLNVIVSDHFNVISSVIPIKVLDESGKDGEMVNDSTVATGAGKDTAASSTSFVESVRQFLCVSLIRNATSLVSDVLDRSLDIFVQIVKGMRHHLKKEIELFMYEIVIGLLDNNQSLAGVKSGSFTITYHQKLALIKHITLLFQDARVLVDMFVNYDCDPDALDNIIERLVTYLSKLIGRSDLKLILPQSGTEKGNGVLTKDTISSLVGVGNIDVGRFSVRQSSKGNILQGRARAGSNASAVSSSNVPSTYQSASASNNAQTLSSGFKQQQSILTQLGVLGQERENSIKFRALECLATILDSLLLWSRGAFEQQSVNALNMADNVENAVSPVTSTNQGNGFNVGESQGAGGVQLQQQQSVKGEDDFNRFEAAKHQKQAIREGVQLFNWKYKKGLQFLIANNVIQSNPPSIAQFLLRTPGLNKKVIGEYLGEGEEFNISVMHAFVDELQFDKLSFVEALRLFLQKFRLPGEAQKIDRFMLKFAERFHLQNPGVFLNADTAYVLAYSVVMLNTDQHNPQIKKRMTREEFIKNNRGISDGKDLDPQFLSSIFDEISQNEIKMKDEEGLATLKKASSADFESLSSRQKREAIMRIRQDISNKSDAAVRGFVDKAKKTGTSSPFYSARHTEHAKGMMESFWIPILAGISASLQECDMNDLQTSQLALIAFKSAICICCNFSPDLALSRNAFVSTLTKYAYVSHPTEFLSKAKSVLCISCLLDCGYICGDGLGESWGDVLRCASNLERVVGRGNDPAHSMILGVGVNIVNSSSDGSTSSKHTDMHRKQRDAHNEEMDRQMSAQDKIIIESTAQALLVQVDRIYTSSVRLNGSSIVEFVRYLSQVSMEEIQQSTSSSTLTTVPRMYSLTKLVEISYYNMNRIRLEWSNIWTILGDHFNVVGCHANQHVAFFSVDSLRQLSMKFLEKDELVNFKFQKDFMKPFEYILMKNQSMVIKDMVLRCVHQIIQAKAVSIKSGWKTLLSVLKTAAKEPQEAIVNLAFDSCKFIFNGKFMESLVQNNAFEDFVSCLVEFGRNGVSNKISLLSVDMLNQTVSKVMVVIEQIKKGKKTLDIVVAQSAASTEADSAQLQQPATSQSIQNVNKSATTNDDPIMRLWFPIYFGFYEMIMTCELESRTKALKYLFDTLKEHSAEYTPEFWDVLSRGVLFPIFDDLKLTRSEKRKFENREDMTVWLNTTLIQALRQFVDLVSFSFASLESMMLDGVLDLIRVCFGVPQENETLAKIGSSCLQQLIESNVDKLTTKHWDKIIDTVVFLFESTTASKLFEPDFQQEVFARAEKKSGDQQQSQQQQQKHSRTVSVVSEQSLDSPHSAKQQSTESQQQQQQDQEQQSQHPEQSSNDVQDSDQVSHRKSRHIKKDFQQIIIKSVLQLLVIQTVSDLLSVSNSVPVYKYLDGQHLSRVLKCLQESYEFANRFNGEMQFRVALYKIGFMNQLPNLLKQETTAISCLLTSVFRIYNGVYGLSADTSQSQGANGVIKDPEMVQYAEDSICKYSVAVLTHFNSLEPQVKQRNIQTWTPVVVKILEGHCAMSDAKYKSNIPLIYKLVLEVISKHDLAQDLRRAVFECLVRVDQVFGISSSVTSSLNGLPQQQ
ncbi:hypothetical protein MIR68_007260 [Amoeboaphelidium protococcarum]|nr:hypothetical protein MIR68_007260 [Amoeboaphelidium protococcarum]